MDFFNNDGNDDGPQIEDENRHDEGSHDFYNNQGVFNNQEANHGGQNQQSGYNNMNNDFQEDPEEIQRKLDRSKEEAIKREKLVKKMNLEIELKQEIRNKAIEWVENTNNLYRKNLTSKREFNKNNEADFLTSRDNIKQGKTNPWDVVVSNIDLRESDYKGSKDVSRMKNVIITRKGDFSNLKMK